MLNWTILTVIAVIGISLLADEAVPTPPPTTIASAVGTQTLTAPSSLP